MSYHEQSAAHLDVELEDIINRHEKSSEQMRMKMETERLHHKNLLAERIKRRSRHRLYLGRRGAPLASARCPGERLRASIVCAARTNSAAGDSAGGDGSVCVVGSSVLMLPCT